MYVTCLLQGIKHVKLSINGFLLDQKSLVRYENSIDVLTTSFLKTTWFNFSHYYHYIDIFVFSIKALERIQRTIQYRILTSSISCLQATSLTIRENLTCTYYKIYWFFATDGAGPAEAPTDIYYGKSCKCGRRIFDHSYVLVQYCTYRCYVLPIPYYDFLFLAYSMAQSPCYCSQHFPLIRNIPYYVSSFEHSPFADAYDYPYGSISELLATTRGPRQARIFSRAALNATFEDAA